METYKLIRKICLTLTLIASVFIIYITYQAAGESAWFGLYLSTVLFIIVYVLFMIIEKIIKTVKKTKVFSDKQYLQAYSEVEENNIQNKELWAKAFAQCGGDIEKQKSIYVQLRTKELSKDD